MNALKEGFRRTVREPFAVGALLVFHLAWSVPLYRFIEARVTEVMSRWPPPELGRERAGLFVYDFLLTAQDVSVLLPLVGTLAACGLVRLVMVPALEAGVIDSLRDEHTPRGTAFIRGVRRLSVSFIWLYMLRLLLLAAPLWWVVPAVARSWSGAGTPMQFVLGAAPWLALMAAWTAVVKLLMMYVLFALADDDRLLAALGFALRRLLPVAGIALAVCAVSLAAGFALLAASLYWAGFVSVVLYLVYPLLKVWLRVWGIAAQYRYWRTRRT